MPTGNLGRLVAVCATLMTAICPGIAMACSTKAVAYLAAMKSDLRNLAQLQDVYFQQHRRYASDLASLSEFVPPGFQTSTAVTVTLERGDERGWVARARHTQLANQCTFGAGPGAPNTAGGPSCDPLNDPYRTRATARI